MIQPDAKPRFPQSRGARAARPGRVWFWVGWTGLALGGAVALRGLPAAAWWGHGPFVAGTGHAVRLILAGFLFASAAAIGDGVWVFLGRLGRRGANGIDKQKHLSDGGGAIGLSEAAGSGKESVQSDPSDLSDLSHKSDGPDRRDPSDCSDGRVRPDQSSSTGQIAPLLSVRIVLGLAVLTVVLFALAAWGLWRPAVFWGLFAVQGVALIVWGWRRGHAGRDRVWESQGRAQWEDTAKSQGAAESESTAESTPRPVSLRRPGRGSRVRSPEWVVGWVLALVYGLPSLLIALTPPFGWDDQVYHLPLPKAYLAHGGFFAMPWNFFAQQPGQMDLLYGWALAFGDGTVAALVHFGLGVTVCLGLWEIARRMGYCRAAWVAPALFLCHFMVGEEMGWAFSDVGMAAFLLAAWWVLWTWVRGRGGRYGWAVAGILAGVVCASKYTGGLLVAGVGVWALIAGIWAKRSAPTVPTGPTGQTHPTGQTSPTGLPPPTGRAGRAVSSHRSRPFPRSGWVLVFGIAGFVLLGFLVLSTWLVKNFCFTDNPVWPLLYSHFDGRGWTAWLNRELVSWQRGDYGPGRSLLDWVLLLPRVFFVSDYSATHFGGSLAVLPLAGAVLSLALPGKARRRAWLPLSCFLLLFVLWGLGSQQTRFLVPALPLLALGALPAVREVFHSTIPWRRWLVGAALGGALIANLAGTALPRWQSADKARRVLLGLDSREAFLSVAVRSYDCFRYIESLPGKERGRYVLFLFEPMGYYADFPHRFDVMQVSTAVEEAGECGSGEAFARRLQVEGVDLVLVNHAILDEFLPLLQGPPPFPMFGGDRAIQDHYRKGLHVVEDFLRHHAVEVYRSHNSAVYRVHP